MSSPEAITAPKAACFAMPSEARTYAEKASAFLALLLKNKVVDGVTVPVWTGETAIYQLVTDPACLAAADPFAPVMLRNAAEQLAELTRQKSSRPLAVVLRSCEMRAFIELVKLQQAHLDNILLIGSDCLGTKPVLAMRAGGVEVSQKILLEPLPVESMRTACRFCDLRTPPAGDLILCALGVDLNGPLVIEAKTEVGFKVMASIGLAETPAPASRQQCLEGLAQAAREELAKASADDLLQHLHRCARCYNCRDMCPICYCPECFFTPAKLGYSTEKYLDWARKKGSITLPTDVLLFHLTRMNHMLTSCVGCGMCESACPNGIPLGRIYSVLRHQVQALYNYEAGRSLTEPLPVKVFLENELSQVEE